MGGFRARDADRDRYVEVIESAYVDGQLGEHDRELRVSRALTAETLDELPVRHGVLGAGRDGLVLGQRPSRRPVGAGLGDRR